MPVLKPPMSASSRADLIIFFALDSPISAVSARSAGEAVAILSTVT